MTVLRGSWQTWPTPETPTAVTIGVLDGVHRGHRALISRLDPSMTQTVLTFDPHPVEVLRRGIPPRLITTIDERIDLLVSAGVECIGILDLAEIKDQSPREFVEAVLVATLGVGQLVVGEDFRFGKDRAGDVDLLRRLGGEHGFEVVTIEILGDGAAPVSSSRIRQLIESGAVAEAARLLGSRFTVTNEIVRGDARGRDLGFPTANLRPPHRKLVPAHGVYACFATLDGDRYHAAVNVGVRPTFGGGELLVEAHLIDFEAEIYGSDLTVEFVEYLRPEVSFADVAQLVAQMNSDVDHTREILETIRSPM